MGAKERKPPVKLIFLGACVCFLAAAIVASAIAVDDGSTRWSTGEWIAWRDRQIRTILTPTFDTGAGKILSKDDVVQRCIDAYAVIGPNLDRPRFFTDPLRKQALGNFVSFLQSQIRMAYHNRDGVHTNLLGYPITDREYWFRHGDALRLPRLVCDQDFLQSMSDPSSYSQALRMIRRQNESLPPERKWVVLFYRSRFLKSVDTATYGRMLVLAPNDRQADGTYIDRWIQFAAVPPGETVVKPVRSISMVAVRRERFGVSKATGYLADFMRVRAMEGSTTKIVPTMLLDKSPSKNCYDCHKTPVLPIHPKRTFTFSDAGQLILEDRLAAQTIQTMDAAIGRYVDCDLKEVAYDEYGPSVGPVGRERTDEILRRTSSDPELSGESLERIRQAMNCGNCHRGPTALNFPTSAETTVGFQNFEAKKGLVQTYIEQGWMPPGPTLSDREKRDLWRSLDAEYLEPTGPDGPSGLLVDWLKALPSK
ncbi:MAG: hypothetical protein P4L46_11965 [Fimbriimonas sp.]|nr:hypothetical protein [Fimbriimonas sp.]